VCSFELNFDRFAVKLHFRILKMIAIRDSGYQCTKFVFGRGFDPDPLGELTALLQGRGRDGRG